MLMARASALVTSRWVRITSVITWPTVNTGSSEVRGSWKIIEMRSKRTARTRRSGSWVRSLLSKTISPEVIRTGGVGSSRMIDSAVIVLPHPLSPTRQSTSLGLMSKDTSRTTSNEPSGVDTAVWRLRTERTGPRPEPLAATWVVSELMSGAARSALSELMSGAARSALSELMSGAAWGWPRCSRHRRASCSAQRW